MCTNATWLEKHVSMLVRSTYYTKGSTRGDAVHDGHFQHSCTPYSVLVDPEPKSHLSPGSVFYMMTNHQLVFRISRPVRLRGRANAWPMTIWCMDHFAQDSILAVVGRCDTTKYILVTEYIRMRMERYKAVMWIHDLGDLGNLFFSSSDYQSSIIS